MSENYLHSITNYCAIKNAWKSLVQLNKNVLAQQKSIKNVKS